MENGHEAASRGAFPPQTSSALDSVYAQGPNQRGQVLHLLATRNLTADVIEERVTTPVGSHDLGAEYQEVEFDDLVKLAKVSSRPWSYLLIDAGRGLPERRE